MKIKTADSLGFKKVHEDTTLKAYFKWLTNLFISGSPSADASHRLFNIKMLGFDSLSLTL